MTYFNTDMEQTHCKVLGPIIERIWEKKSAAQAPPKRLRRCCRDCSYRLRYAELLDEVIELMTGELPPNLRDVATELTGHLLQESGQPVVAK